MNGKNTLIVVLAVLLFGAFPVASSAAVSVFVEGAYTDTDLVCYVYVDTDGDSLISGGVRLSYSTAELSNPVATKNEDDWYFEWQGLENPGVEPYMDPDISTPGEIIFIVGKLVGTEPPSPPAGVNDSRALIGRVTFDRDSTSDPGYGAAAAAFFGLQIDLGRVSPYINFVNTGGTELDDGGISFEHPDFPTLDVMIAERGDANADGDVNVQDMGAVRYYMQHGGNDNPWKDCNADGVINVQDMGCVRYMMTH